MQIDYLIVGRGLAGAVLGFQLEQKGQKVAFVDKEYNSSSSRIALGIVNPVTGRKMVKSWKVDTLIPKARSFYKKVEEQIGEQIIHETKVLRLFTANGDINEWETKVGTPAYDKYLGDSFAIEDKSILAPFGGGFIKQSFWLDISLMLDKLKKTSIIYNESFDYDLLKVSTDKITYKNIEAKGVVFCEGYEGVDNPFFKDLPFVLAKGEILTIETAMEREEILNRNLSIQPWEKNKYRVGATFSWDDLNEEPTEHKKEELLQKLNKVLKIDYKVVDHKAGIRPTVKDRRPLLGQHAKYTNLFFFNGLGTKGVSLAPYCSERMV